MTFEMPPPGGGLNTVRVAVVLLERSVGEIVAINCELLRIVGRSEPFQRTIDVDTNCAPLIVRLSPGVPALALLGESDVIRGTGLLDCADRQVNNKGQVQVMSSSRVTIFTI